MTDSQTSRGEFDIPWFGQASYAKTSGLVIKMFMGKTVKQFPHADEGLESISERNFPLIIVDDMVGAGQTLDVPPGTSLDNLYDIPCELMRRVRLIGPNQRTPIIMLYVPTRQSGDGRGYIKAGATDCMQADSVLDNSFIRKVREYLR